MVFPIKKNSTNNSFYKRLIIAGSIILLMIVGVSCSNPQKSVVRIKWGEVNDQPVYLYTLQNAHNMVVKITNYGGIITSVITPDKNGHQDDVVLGFDNLEQYLAPNPCFGALIGRFANRIKNGEFIINDHLYQLTKNDNGNCAHGGNEFDKSVWDSEILNDTNLPSIRLHLLSKDGQNGFPGNLEIYVTYTLTDENAIQVHYEAQTDKTTHVNLTQHSYFNLTGVKEPIYNHLIKIDADNYTEIDEDIVPTGIISTVKGEDWDLTHLTRIGDNIHKLDFNGYHYCYIFNKPQKKLADVIQVIEPSSGRTLDVYTTQPGVQFYSGNAIDSTLRGKYGIQYGPHWAFCLETQHFPDSPNHPNFPSTLLHPGEKYDEQVIFDFGVMDENH